MKKVLLLTAFFAALLSIESCKHEVTIKDESPHVVDINFNTPLQINMDINVKIDNALDDFYGDLDELDAQTE